MTPDEARVAIEEYGALVDRALDIVDQAPYWKHISEAEFARLEIAGEQAILRYPELESGYYDSGDTIESRDVSFPAYLLFLSEDVFKKWKAVERAAYDEKERKADAARIVERERKERAELAALKAKYGE